MSNDRNEPGRSHDVGRYSARSGLLEFICGITYEIWEERGVDLIRSYYAEDIEMLALSGPSVGVERIFDGTRETLAAFPDRRLLAENIIWSADRFGDYSSHRILSPMTHQGASTAWGPATGRTLSVRTVADCLVRDGRIVQEWLLRDNLSAAEQLDLDPLALARTQAAATPAATRDWWAAQWARTRAGDAALEGDDLPERALRAQWSSGDPADFNACFPHYAVAHPAPGQVVSGREALLAYWANLRASFGDARVVVEHIARQPWGHDGEDVAVRWSVAAVHQGDYRGLPATGRATYIMGSSHWRVIDGRIAAEWIVFDGLSVLAQLCS